MNNLLDFLQYREHMRNIVLNEKESKDNEQKKYEIDVEKHIDGTVEVSGPDEELKGKKSKIETILMDNEDLLTIVTGDCNIGNFKNHIAKNHLKFIKSLKENSKIEYPLPEEGSSFCSIEGMNKKEMQELFKLMPPEGANLGKGEVLLASYYSNIKRLLEKTVGGVPGDCAVYDEKTGKIERHLEVKSGKAQFNLQCDENIIDIIDKNYLNDKKINTSKGNGSFNIDVLGKPLMDVVMNGIVKYLHGQKTASRRDRFDMINGKEEDGWKLPNTGCNKLSLIFFDNVECGSTELKIDGDKLHYYNVDIPNDRNKILENFIKHITNITFVLPKRKDFKKIAPSNELPSDEKVLKFIENNKSHKLSSIDAMRHDLYEVIMKDIDCEEDKDKKKNLMTILDNLKELNFNKITNMDKGVVLNTLLTLFDLIKAGRKKVTLKKDESAYNNLSNLTTILSELLAYYLFPIFTKYKVENESPELNGIFQKIKDIKKGRNIDKMHAVWNEVFGKIEGLDDDTKKKLQNSLDVYLKVHENNEKNSKIYNEYKLREQLTNNLPSYTLFIYEPGTLVVDFTLSSKPLSDISETDDEEDDEIDTENGEE